MGIVFGLVIVRWLFFRCVVRFFLVSVSVFEFIGLIKMSVLDVMEVIVFG